jgi:large subunit ribosomal protein L25
MSETFALEAVFREVRGKAVRHNRRQGQIPGVIYGPGFDPMPIFLTEYDLRQTLAKAGGTHLIEISIGQEKVPALAREVQRDPIKGNLIHIDFYRVAMDRLIRTEVPIVLVGQSSAVTSKQAIVLQPLNSVEIETLPGNLPESIKVDISGLTRIGEQVTVGDLQAPPDVRIVTSPDEMVLKLDYAESVAVEDEGPATPVSAEVEVITARKEEDEEV